MARLLIDSQLIDAGWAADTERLTHAQGARPQLQPFSFSDSAMRLWVLPFHLDNAEMAAPDELRPLLTPARAGVV